MGILFWNLMLSDPSWPLKVISLQWIARNVLSLNLRVKTKGNKSRVLWAVTWHLQEGQITIINFLPNERNIDYSNFKAFCNHATSFNWFAGLESAFMTDYDIFGTLQTLKEYLKSAHAKILFTHLSNSRLLHLNNSLIPGLVK